MSGVHLTKGLWDAESLARSLFMDDPDLSIDDAARQVSESFRRGLGKEVLSRIRRDVREHINRAMDGGSRGPRPMAPTIEKREGFVNHPRVAVAPKTSPVPAVAAAPAPAPEVVKTAVESAVRRGMVDTNEKRRWFGDWAMANPWSTIKEARAALHAQFGEGLGTDYIGDTLKAARHLVVEERDKAKAAEEKPAVAVAAPALVTVPSIVPLPALHVPVVEERSLRVVVRDIVAVMRGAGVKSIRLNSDGTVDFETGLQAL